MNAMDYITEPPMGTMVEGAFLLAKQEDGNYKGWTWKYGKMIEVRDVGPETVLQLLLTHDGK